MPLYMGWQQKAIKRILGSLGDAATAAKRVGVFSTWIHASKESLGESKPAIVDIYLHTKSALIDNRWATVGSANLDGASLDYIQYARAFFDSDVRNTEANLVVFEDTGTIVSAVDALRRRSGPSTSASRTLPIRSSTTRQARTGLRSGVNVLPPS